MRLCAVLSPKIEPGAAANAAAIVIGGLRCEGFGEPLLDATGHAHAAVLWNLVVLRAKTAGQLATLLETAKAESVQAVAFTSLGQEFSNSFSTYGEEIARRPAGELDLVAVGLFGEDEAVRRVTRQFSLFR